MDLREVVEFLKDAFKYIVAIIIAVVIFLFVITFQQIVGNSMSPTLNDGEVVLLSKIGVKLTGIKRNQIIALKTEDGKLYVKRVIGLPGENIKYMNNILYINDVGYTEDYLNEEVKTNNFELRDIVTCENNGCPGNVIPDDMYLVLGDNREDSLDSRDKSLGLVPKKNIIGKTSFRIWPLSKIGSTN